MATYNIGPKIGIEGEKEFRAQISRINREYSAMESYTKAVSTAMAQQGKSQELLASKSNALQQQIAQQQQKYKLLADALAKVQAKTGENSQETLRYKGALLDVENTLSSLQAALAETAQEMTDLANGVQHIETAAERAERNLGEYRQEMARLNDEYDAATTYTQAVSRGMDATGASMEGLSNKATGLYRQLDLQQQRFENLHNALRAATELYGENSAEVLRFEATLEDVKTSTAALQRELSATENDLNRMARGLDDVGDAAEVADDKVLSFGDVLKAGIASGAILNGLERAGELIVEVGSASIEAAAEVKAANAQFSQTFGDLESTATSALRSISDETGIAVTRLQGGYTALYAFTKSVGGDQQTALNIAQRALRAAADSAAYYDRTMEDATETLQSFLKGNYENDAALGIAATETTRNAKANELYAKSFKDLSEAQKVDTLLAMVEAGNAASGALGQAAREADSWANVTGELSEAWRQMLASLGSPVLSALTPMIQGITGAINDLLAVSEWQKLNTSVADFEAGMRNAETALADSNSEMAATASLAQQYVSRLREIEGAGLDSAEAQGEYARTVQLLNQLMPELGLTINKNTGRLEQNTDSILENIDALQAQYRAQARQEYYADIIAQQVAVEKELIAARLRQTELENRRQILLDQGAQVLEKYTAAELGSAGAAADLASSTSAADRELTQIVTELAATEGAIRQGEEAMAGYADQLAAAADAAGELENAAKPVEDSVNKMTDAYNAAKSAARDSIDSQIGLFQELSDESTMSAERIVQNWNKQRDALLNYGDNLREAVDMGLDEALVRQLSDGTEQSMLILEEFVNGTELSVEEINAAFRDRMKADDYWSESVGRMELVLTNEFKQMAKYAKAAGLDIVDGAADGILNNISKYEQALKRLASRGQQAYRHEWSINSPSRVMMENSDYIIDGGVLQIQRRTRDMERAMADLAKSGNQAYLQEKLDYAAQYPSMVAGAPGYGGTTTNNSSVAYGGISININTQPGQDAQSIADAVLEELTVRLGREEARF